MGTVKTAILDFFNTLSVYDYVGFIITIVLFTLFLILALLLRRRTKLSMIFVVIAFIFFFAGPSAAHIFVKKTIFKSTPTLGEVKKLVYSDTLLIKGALFYIGQKDANHCKVEAHVHKRSTNSIKDFAYDLKTYKLGSDTIDKKFTKGDRVDFKIVIEPFTYKGDYNITLNSGCFK